MKKRCVLCILFATVILLQSCSVRKTYKAEYPEYLTDRYWRGDYVAADPNLTYFICAKNSFSEYEYSGNKWKFYALKDVPMDKYLCSITRAIILDPYYHHVLLKHKDITEEPVLYCNATACTLFWGCRWFGRDSEMQNFGNEAIVEVLSSLDAASIQNHIKDCITNETFVTNDGLLSMVFTSIREGGGNAIGAAMTIRLQFAEYDNIIWDTQVYQDVKDNYEAKYYMLVYVPNEDFEADYEFNYYNGGENYYERYIPVPAELESLIDEAINNKE